MKIIDKIKEKLQKYPHIRYEASEGSITVFPASDNGFEVSLYVGEHEDFAVYYNGWHEDFDTGEEALECFAFGLSSECRLKETSRGGSYVQVDDGIPARWRMARWWYYLPSLLPVLESEAGKVSSK